MMNLQPICNAADTSHGLPASKPSPWRRRRPLAVAVLTFLLGACSALPEPPPSVALYDFGPNTSATREAASPIRTQRLLMLGAVTADGLTADQQALLYRYAYADDHQLRAYQRARWSLPVEQLVTQQLRHQLQGQWAVLTPDHERARLTGGASAPLVLYVDLERFEQVFTDDQTSAGAVALQATVLRGEGGRLLAQRSFRRAVDARTADAAGGAKALADAAREVAADVDQWLRTLTP